MFLFSCSPAIKAARNKLFYSEKTAEAIYTKGTVSEMLDHLLKLVENRSKNPNFMPPGDGSVKDGDERWAIKSIAF